MADAGSNFTSRRKLARAALLDLDSSDSARPSLKCGPRFRYCSGVAIAARRRRIFFRSAVCLPGAARARYRDSSPAPTLSTTITTTAAAPDSEHSLGPSMVYSARLADGPSRFWRGGRPSRFAIGAAIGTYPWWRSADGRFSALGNSEHRGRLLYTPRARWSLAYVALGELNGIRIHGPGDRAGRVFCDGTALLRSRPLGIDTARLHGRRNPAREQRSATSRATPRHGKRTPGKRYSGATPPTYELVAPRCGSLRDHAGSPCSPRTIPWTVLLVFITISRAALDQNPNR